MRGRFRYRQLQLTSNFGRSNTVNIQTPTGWKFVQNKTLADQLKGKCKMALLYLIMTFAQKYEEEE